MSRVDPASNGDLRHNGRPPKGAGRRPPRPVDPARRGRWVVTVAVISAAVGAFLLLGASLAGVIRHFTGIPIEVLFVFVLGVTVGGVWVGAWVSGRLTGGNRKRYIATGIGGCVGLVVAIGLGYASTKALGGILDLVAILSPGAVAAIAGNATEREGPRGPQG